MKKNKKNILHKIDKSQRHHFTLPQKNPIHRSIGPLDQETHFVDLGVEPTPLPQIIKGSDWDSDSCQLLTHEGIPMGRLVYLPSCFLDLYGKW